MSSRSWPAAFVTLLALALLAAASGIAAEPVPQPGAQPTGEPSVSPLQRDIADGVVRLKSTIDLAEKKFQQLTELGDDVGNLRGDVEQILAEASQIAESLRPQLAAVTSQIDKLGPAPAKDGPAEAAGIAGERTRLSALAANIDGAIKSTQLIWVRARQLVEKITVLRHSLFAKNLMQRVPSPLLATLWRDLDSETPAVGRRIAYLAHDWEQWAAPKASELGMLLAVAAVVFFGLSLLAARLTRRDIAPEPAPSFFERVVGVAWVAPLRALPPIAACLVLYAGLEAMDLLFPPWTSVANAAVKAVLLLASIAALLRAVLAPHAPRWRLVALADAPARRIGWLLYAIACVYVLDAAMTENSRAFLVPLPLSVAQALATTSLFALLLVGLLLTPFTPQAVPAEPTSRQHPRLIKLPLWLLAIAMPALALIGYVALARFLAQQVIMTGVVVIVGLLLYLAIRAVTRDTQQRRYAIGELLERRFGLDAPRRNQLAHLSEFALSLALVIAAIPFLMLQWGYSGADILDGFQALLFGLQIGQFHISLARILIGVVLFIALLFATRLLQRWLRERALHQTRLDAGVVNSIDTVVGYAGTTVAALVAVSYAGLDITNIAIVAGALSVGIGFGLQSIVNNFVSGLILLIERPIKVGDWIVLGAEQGNVRRISVRATEIETFDRASLIIPNSELITGRVLNWTHRNAMGRVILRIGVGYHSDPEQVMAILKACADAHPGVLKEPPSVSAFDNFGDSALQFSLRVYLADISQALSVQSDLRVAMLKALRAADIEIPFNQIDVNVRALKSWREELRRPAGVRLQEGAAERASVANGKPLAEA
jgi:small-conductance mechanosensitive channel